MAWTFDGLSGAVNKDIEHYWNICALICPGILYCG